MSPNTNIRMRSSFSTIRSLSSTSWGSTASAFALLRSFLRLSTAALSSFTAFWTQATAARHKWRLHSSFCVLMITVSSRFLDDSVRSICLRRFFSRPSSAGESLYSLSGTHRRIPSPPKLEASLSASENSIAPRCVSAVWYNWMFSVLLPIKSRRLRTNGLIFHQI